MDCILLTGPSGYLGSAVAQRLDALQLRWQALPTRLEDIEPASLPHQVVIHCAGALRNRPNDWQISNVQGMARLLNGLRNVSRVIFASSRSVYGPSNADSHLEESFPTAPRDGYGLSKLAAEKILHASRHVGVCARMTTLFGFAPRCNTMALPNRAAQLFRDGKSVQLVRKDIQIDYLAVSDAARLLVDLAVRTEVDSYCINLAGPVRSLHQLIEKFARASADVYAQQPLIDFDYSGANESVFLDTRKLSHLFPGYAPTPDSEVARTLVHCIR